MGVTLTDRAAEHIKGYLDKRGKGLGLRLAVRTTGCSGLAYVIEFADEVAANDEVFEDNDITVIIDKKSLVYLEGTELDFTREGLNEGFLFKNPNVKDECGCGESFTI
jgi:iron-sulfur cluster assembly protein